ncbi:MAG: AAA family ATPase [Actinomycetota bacterium]
MRRAESLTGNSGRQRLLERDVELDHISSVLDLAADGEGAALLIQGPAGVGKTELLQHACALARDRGMNVLSGRGHHLERDFPYGVVRQLLESSLVRAVQASPELLHGSAGMALSALSADPMVNLGSGGHPEHFEAVSYAALHGLYWFCSNLSELAPLLIGVDDSQWADVPSQRFLLYMARRLDNLPIVIVLTHRQGEGSAELVEELASESSIQMLRPRPLGQDSVAKMLDSWLSEPPADAFVSSCHWATGGNPFMLRELLLGLKERRLKPTGENANRISELRLPSVSKSVMKRLKQLPENAIELAGALALLGSGNSLQDAARLAGLDPADAVGAVDHLVAMDILKPGPTLEFVHPIVSAAVYDQVPPGHRRLQQGNAARFLAQDDAAVDRIAGHLLEAEPLGDSWAVEVLRDAAGQAIARGVPQSAVAYLRRALLEPPPKSVRSEVLFELGEAEVALDPALAVDHLTHALDLSIDPSKRATICLTLLRALMQVGRVEDAVGEVKKCIAALGEDDAELALRLEAELISALRQGLATSPLADESIERWKGRVDGRTPSERLMLTHLAAQSALRGRDADTVAGLAQQALGNGQLLSDQSSASSLYYLPVYQLICADRFELAEAQLDQAAGDARTRGSPLGFTMVSAFRSYLAFARGNMGDAEAEARSAINGAERLGWTYGLPIALDGLISALAVQGSFEETEELLLKYGMAGALPDTVPSRLLLCSRGHIRLAQSRNQEALDDFLELTRREEQSGPANLFLTPYRSLAALATFRLGEPEPACRMIDECLVAARTWGAPRIVAMTLRSAAAIKGGEHGLDLLSEAVALMDESQALLVQAQCQVDYGAALRRAGKRNESFAPLRRGLEIAYRCQAKPLIQQAREELMVLGARPRRGAISGIDSLTASERRVAQMAAEGMPNRAIAQALFVTNRTVEVHLTHAYQKLGIRSRDGLGVAMSRA